MKDKTFRKMWSILHLNVDTKIVEAMKTQKEVERFLKDASEKAEERDDDASAVSDKIYAQCTASEYDGMTKVLLWVRKRMGEIEKEMENYDD